MGKVKSTASFWKVIVSGLLIGTLVLLMGSNHLLSVITQRQLRIIESRGFYGMLQEIRPWARKVGISSPRSITWSDLGMTFALQRGRLRGIGFVAQGDHLSLKVKSLAPFLLEVEALGFGGSISSNARSQVRGKTYQEIPGYLQDLLVEVDRFRFTREISTLDVEVEIDRLVDEVSLIGSAGRVAEPFEIAGKVKFRMRDKAAELRILSEEMEQGWGIAINRDDLAELSGQNDLDTNDVEIDLLARYPTRVYRLLQIKDQANKVSLEWTKNQTRISTDAAKHVYWSYLLTREFGPGFAELVTNAHEEGSTNSDEDKAMDYQNNAVGRIYAARGLTDREVFEELKYDRAIVHGVRPQPN